MMAATALIFKTPGIFPSSPETFSLTSQASKVLERTVGHTLLQRLHGNNLDPPQHDFPLYTPYISNMLCVMTKAYDSGYN